MHVALWSSHILCLSEALSIIVAASSGGICERYKEFKENGRKVMKSLNTGIVSIVNYNKRVPFKVSQLTFAHEMGHNFGSPVCYKHILTDSKNATLTSLYIFQKTVVCKIPLLR